jgi:hypothetical protein
LKALIHWLGNTELSNFIKTVTWIIPGVQVVHILAISVVVASMGMFDLRLLGWVGRRHSIASFAARFLPWLWGALLVLLLSGVTLIIGEPERSLGNLVFQLKMALLLTAVCVTLGFRRLLLHDLATGASDLRPEHGRAAQFVGGVSLCLWVGIVTAGRWIAYAG